MKYGIYFAYWTKEWFADYKKYMDKVSALGFDVLEISCAALRDVYTTKEQLIELREYAKEKGLVRMEGKEYVVKDGDVVLFRFNV